jgi:hypothetical protein
VSSSLSKEKMLEFFVSYILKKLAELSEDIGLGEKMVADYMRFYNK